MRLDVTKAFDDGKLYLIIGRPSRLGACAPKGIDRDREASLVRVMSRPLGGQVCCYLLLDDARVLPYSDQSNNWPELTAEVATRLHMPEPDFDASITLHITSPANSGKI